MHISFRRLKPNKQNMSKMTTCMIPRIWTLGTAHSINSRAASPGRDSIGTAESLSRSKKPLGHWKFEISA